MLGAVLVENQVRTCEGMERPRQFAKPRGLKPAAQLAALGLLLSSTLALAGPLPPQFTLGRYVPDDAFLFINEVHNPERDWIDARWRGVFDALVNSGIDRDLVALACTFIGEDDPAGIHGPSLQARIDSAVAMLKAVQWSDLLGREVAFAERLTTTLPGYEYVALARGKPETIDTNLAGLVAIFKEFASLSDGITIARRSVRGVDVWSMSVAGGPGHRVWKDDSPLPIASPKSKEKGSPGFNLNINLFRRGDVIGLVIGPKLAGEVLELMASDRLGRSILTSPRFGKAVAQLKSPSDFVLFGDVRLAMRQATKLVETVAAQRHGKTEQAARKVDKALALFDVVDFTVSTRRTEGRRSYSQKVTRFQPGKTNTPLARAFLHRAPFERFDRYIPAEAVGFRLDPLVDLQPLYQIVVEFISDEITGGAEAIGRWNVLLSSLGFDPQRDLFSWLSGEMITVTVPTCVSTPMRCTDTVHMLRLKDPALASQKINSAIDFINTKLAALGHMLIVSPAKVKAEGFRTITHSAVAMFISPVIGVKDDWLFIGTSASAINKCLATAAGKAPSIRMNERFRREGLIPDGPVRSASFTDKSNVGAEWGEIAGTLGMIGTMAVATIPDHAHSQEVKQLLQRVLPIAMKLRPVLQMIDFYSSESAVTTFDGFTLREQRVVTYKGSAPSDSPQAVKVPCRVRQ